MPRSFEAAVATRSKGPLERADGAGRPAPSATVAISRLRWATLAVAFLLPLVVVPGFARPFSTPKFVLLAAVVSVGTLLAASYGLLRWPSFPFSFQVALVVWLAALGASAAFGDFASPSAFFLPLFAAAWFLLLLMIRPRAEDLAFMLALSGGMVALIALLQFFGLDPFALLGWAAPPGGSSRIRVFATLGNPNFVAAFLVAVMPLTIAMGITLRQRLLFSVVVALQTAAIFATGSRAAILALIAVLVWLAVLRRLVNWRYLAGTAVLIAVLLLVYAPSRPLKTTLLGRYYIWHVTATHLAERPVFGFGPGGFAAKYVEWETEYWREGRSSASERQFAALQDHAHNDYLETLVDSGVAGLASFVALLLSSLVFAFRQAQRKVSELATGASAGVIALMAVALVDFPFRRPTELFLFWTLMGLVFLAATPQATVRGGPSKA